MAITGLNKSNAINISKSVSHDEKKSFRHIDARTVEEAVSYLSIENVDARIIAGGVDLLGLMKKGIIAPQILVNIKTIPGLKYITEDSTGLKIGALTDITEITESEEIKQKYLVLSEAAKSIASPHIRNMATVAGNLCQETRCWYWRRSPHTGTTFYCLRKGGEHCYAITGENAYHSIFGETGCRSVSPSDLAPALIALGATVKITGKQGSKIVSLEDFYLPDANILEPDEIITEIQVPASVSNSRQRYLKFRIRKSIDFAIVSVAALVTMDAGKAVDARIVLGGVSSVPYRAKSAEEFIRGKILTDKVAEEAAVYSVVGANPLSKNAYKLPITIALVKRAIFS